MNYLKKVLLAAAVLIAAVIPARAAEAASAFPQHLIGNSQIRVLPKAANGRDYQLYVALPSSYSANPGRRYPVLYLCDGYWDFTLLCGLYGNLIYDKVAPEFIIVGLGYPGEKPDYDSLRAYDYTPMAHPEDKTGAETGHAGEFLSVIEKEIIPFVEKEYRADQAYRVLAGSSLGGLCDVRETGIVPGLHRAKPGVRLGGWSVFRKRSGVREGKRNAQRTAFHDGGD